MEESIRILILEHDNHDVELLKYELKKAGIRHVSMVVQSRSEFEEQLIEFRPDVILSDYNLPSFDGFSAYQIKQKITPEIPFILVSGTIGEENAVTLIKHGATDYVLKDKLYQVAPKLRRAMQEKNDRQRKAQAEIELRQSQQQLQRIMDLSLDMICTFNRDGRFVNVSAASKEILRYTPDELIGKHWHEFIHPEDIKKTTAALIKVAQGFPVLDFENRYIRKDGKAVAIFWSARWDPAENIAYCVGRDATEKKAAEENIRKNEKRFRTIFENSADGLCMLSADGIILEINNAGQKILEYLANELVGRSWFDLIHNFDAPIVQKTLLDSVKDAQADNRIEYRSKRADGIYRWIELNFQNELNEPAIGSVIAHFRDITEKKLAELAITESEERYRNLFDLSPFPMWLFDVNTFQFLDVNNAAIKHYGYSREEFLSMTIKDIRPKEDVDKVVKMVEHTKTTGAFSRGVFTHIKKNGERIFVDIQSNLVDFKGKKARLVLANDISGRIRYIEDIEEKNKRLREIAWIQSHHVRAPVARIKSLINLIKQSDPEEEDISQLLDYIAISVDELDVIIKDIVTKTEEIEKPDHQ
jgi:PAS domain S-box-containing protein